VMIQTSACLFPSFDFGPEKPFYVYNILNSFVNKLGVMSDLFI